MNIDFTSMTEDEWDLYRLPRCISQTEHHIRDFERQIRTFLDRALPGDKFRACRASWFLRNNRSILERYRQRLNELGGTTKPYQPDLFQVSA